jgi:hypothetical protein
MPLFDFYNKWEGQSGNGDKSEDLPKTKFYDGFGNKTNGRF